MNHHQVQGSILVNGEWVSRPVDVYQIMARAQQQQADTEMHEVDALPHSQVPSLGILSRTILPSPLFKFVLPANIRQKDMNDVVLIGEDSIQIKEIRDYGHLRHVATKSDFKGRILAARVFGNPRQAQVAQAVGSPLPNRQILHRGRSSLTGEPQEQHSMPPEVIVLTLTSRTLMFLWARQTYTGVTTFSQRIVRLPAWTSRFDRLGTFLAIDPKCRAIAVAAHEGRFILYKTKPMQQWAKDARAGNDVIPIEDERIISFEGRVMHMEFLASGGAGQDDYHVVLLFILVHAGKTKITCYDWDYRHDLSRATARAERLSVDHEDRNPSLLIPLSRRPDFLLVYERHVSTYKDVLSGVPRHSRVPIPPHILPSLRPGFSKHSDRWVQWDRAIRNPEFTKEAFYIAREDGRVMYAERGLIETLDVDITEAGEWPHPIDTAFACLNVDNTEFSQLFPDVLIAGGAGSDGQLCKVGAWPQEYSYGVSYSGTNAFSHVDSIPNWAPLLDLSVTRLSGLRDPYERERCAIFVANGNAPNGEVSELRRGLHALIDDSFGGIEGCTGLWVLDYGTQAIEAEGKETRQHFATFAINLPPETILIRIHRTQSEIRGNQGEFSGAWDDGIWEKVQLPNEHEPIEDGLVREAETISACPWSDDFSIQISRHEARVLRRPLLSQHSALLFQFPLLLAVTKPAFPLIVVAFRESGSTYLELIWILNEGTFDSQSRVRHKLDFDPTCIELLDLDGSPHIFVGTFDSKVSIFRVQDSERLVAAYESPLEEGILCESAVLLASGDRRVLVCSTRNGFLLSVPLEKMNGSNASWEFVKMGTTSAQIHPSATDNSTAFVACGSDFCRIRCLSRKRWPIQVDSVWFSDNGNPGYAQSPVTAMYQLPLINTSHAGRNLGGFIFAVAGDQLLFSQLDYDIKWSDHVIPSLPHGDTKAVPRKLPTQSKPTKLAYVKALRRMVVATTVAKEERALPEGYRTLHASIKLLSVYDDKPLDEPEVKPEEGRSPVNRLVTEEFPLKHYERVYSILDWAYVTPKGSRHHFLIIGTGITEGAGRETGRRLMLQVGKSGFKLKKGSTYDHPVYSMAMYDSNTMIAVIGKTISLDDFDFEEPAGGRWLRRGTKELPSPCIHVTVSKPFIYVSTLQHSHICYEVVRLGGAREGGIEFEQVFSDSRERSCVHHLILNLEKPTRDTQQPPAAPSSPCQQNDHSQREVSPTDTVVILTDKKSASVTGLYHPPEPTYRNATDTLFEAELPRTVTRLQRGDIRPPWRRRCFQYTEPFEGITGILADDLVGSCSDGTVYNFSILSEDARRLLRFLQIIIELKQNLAPANHSTIVKPRSGDIFDVLMNNCDGSQDTRIRAIDVDPRHQERGQAAPKHKHVDGDLLERFMEEDGNIKDLVCVGTEEDVATLFRELTFEVLEGGREQSVEDCVDLVEMWLSEVLMPVL